jgi:hypothetical protein
MAAWADNVTDAKTYLNQQAIGKDITAFLHFGSKFEGHSFDSQVTVVGANGQPLSGWFGLVYKFKWNSDGTSDWTRVDFVFNAQGKFTNINVRDSSAVFNQPFLAANVSIKLLGSAIAEAMKNKLSEQERKLIANAIDKADAKQLLEVAIALQYNLKK